MRVLLVAALLGLQLVPNLALAGRKAARTTKAPKHKKGPRVKGPNGPMSSRNSFHGHRRPEGRGR